MSTTYNGAKSWMQRRGLISRQFACKVSHSMPLGARKYSQSFGRENTSPSYSNQQYPAVATTQSTVAAGNNLIKLIHNSKYKFVLFVAGGASLAISDLLTVPGASNSVLEVKVPYAQESLIECIGKTPKKFVSSETAADLAHAALRRAAQLSSFGSPILGVAATCSLTSQGTKKGDHKFSIAATNGLRTLVYNINLSKGARTRVQEDSVSSNSVLLILAKMCNIQVSQDDRSFLQLLTDESIVQEEVVIEDPILNLIEGKYQTVEFCGETVLVDCPRSGRIYLPGSFNPLHNGHKGMLQAACKGFQQEGAFELSIGNADKGMLSPDEIRSRVEAFTRSSRDKLAVVLTKEPLFTGKARNLFKNSKFIIGYDTAIRIIMPKYYGNSFVQMVIEFGELASAGCSFIVVGRKDSGDSFKTLKDVSLPRELENLFQGLNEEDFRMDISSTQLREQNLNLKLNQ